LLQKEEGEKIVTAKAGKLTATSTPRNIIRERYCIIKKRLSTKRQKFANLL